MMIKYTPTNHFCKRFHKNAHFPLNNHDHDQLLPLTR